MSSDPRPSTVEPNPGETIDPVRVEKVKDLLPYLANTVSALKIFPSEHATVANFVDQLAQKFTDFLSAYQKLQVGIEEYSFTYGGRPAFTDEVAVKSLPFFFFKDGLLILYFYQGLDRQEILEFLELIKAEAAKPADACDIVAALWERDFPNIQYYAPDEYLENRILAESRESTGRRDLPDLPDELARETIEVRIDASKFSEGRIDLTAEDREEVRKTEAGSRSPAAAMDPTLTEAELHALESMVRTNRTISPEEEYINLMVEIIFLGEDPASCQAGLDALLDYHFDQLQRGQFHGPVLIIQKIHELGRHLAPKPEKAALLDSFLKRTISPKTIEAIQTLLEKKKILDWESLLGFFALLGPSAIGLAADLHEIAPDGQARHRILGFIETEGAADPKLLAAIAAHDRPALARDIVGMLARVPGNRGVPHLASFLSFPDKAIKLEVLHTLAGMHDELAGRILLGFLKDPDEEVRIQAAMKLDPREAGARVQQILREAPGKEFQAKSLKEKEAVLSFLGRTRTPEALDFLRRTLLRAPLFASKHVLEIRLAAAAGLAAMGTEDASAALQQGAIGRTKKIREACRAALESLPPAGRAAV